MSLDPKNPFHILVAILASILILYYIISPYQNCLRDSSFTESGCVRHTSW